MERKGRLFAVADRVADLILLGLVWSVTSVPLLTLGTSCTALYYAVSKSVRFGEGRPLKEYFRAWKENVLQGCVATSIFLTVAVLLMVDGWIMRGKAVFWIILFLMLFLTVTGIYFFPVLSRFRVTVKQCFQVSMVMAVSHIFGTCLLLVTLFLCGLVFLIYPFLLPALAASYAFYTTFVLEKIFRTYTGTQESGNGEWYV